jgi:hypothetical protein
MSHSHRIKLWDLGSPRLAQPARPSPQTSRLLLWPPQTNLHPSPCLQPEPNAPSAPPAAAKATPSAGLSSIPWCMTVFQDRPGWETTWPRICLDDLVPFLTSSTHPTPTHTTTYGKVRNTVCQWQTRCTVLEQAAGGRRRSKESNRGRRVRLRYTHCS